MTAISEPGATGPVTGSANEMYASRGGETADVTVGQTGEQHASDRAGNTADATVDRVVGPHAADAAGGSANPDPAQHGERRTGPRAQPDHHWSSQPPAASPTRKVPAIPEERLVAEAEAHEAAVGDATPAGQMARPSTARRVWRRVLQVGAVVFALVVGYYLISLFQVWSTGNDDYSEPVDAIVVMGAAQYDGRPSPQLAARLDHVVEMWPDGLAPVVVVTGGNQPGDRFTEASTSAAYLADQGVPDAALLLEDEGSNSYESLESVAALLESRGLESVLIVTDPYHALRSKLIAEEVGLDAHVSSTDTSVVTGSDEFGRHLREAAGVSIGRIIGFDRLSDLTD